MGNLCNKGTIVPPNDSQETSDVPQSGKVKFLLLGTGDSGKTTLFKQIRINYVKGYKPSDLIQEKAIIIKGFVSCFGELFEAIISKYKTLGTAELDAKLEGFRNVKEVMSLSADLVEFIKEVWESEQARYIWANREKYQVIESLEYFCNNLDRLADENYEPTEEDYLLCRVRTVGVNQQTYGYRGISIVVLDVGGQRSERSKWIKCFDQVSAVLFVVAMSEFNQNLFEDTGINRLAEAKELFKKTTRFKSFQNTPFVLFFNKEDLFLEKLKNLERKGESLDQHFPELELGGNYEGAADKLKEHMTQTFLALTNHQTIIPHFVTATNTDVFKSIYTAAVQVILQDALKMYFPNV